MQDDYIDSRRKLQKADEAEWQLEEEELAHEEPEEEETPPGNIALVPVNVNTGAVLHPIQRFNIGRDDDTMYVELVIMITNAHLEIPVKYVRRLAEVRRTG